MLGSTLLASSGFANSVTSWGRQVLPPPEELSTLVDVAAGNDFNVAIRPGGSVVAWGSNNLRQATVPEGLENVIAVAAGASHALALRQDGSLVAWGNNRFEQTSVPANVQNVAAVSAGENHSLALLRNGTVVAWGADNHGQTHPPADLEEVTSIAAGMNHNLALLRDGTVVAWGQNDDGQCDVPEDLADVVAIAAGRSHSVALLRDGRVRGWGNDSFGQARSPRDVAGAVRIRAGEDHNVALLEDGRVIAWGRNHYGQTDVPEGLESARRIAAGRNHNLILTEDGTVFAWGNNDHGQALNPRDLESVISIATWETHTVALRQDGTVISWGTALAAGVHPDTDQLQDIVAVAAGRAHGLALRSDGTVVGWGDNFYRQASPPEDLNNVVAIAAGEFHSMALRNNGTVVAWGNNFRGQVNVPRDLGGAMAIAAGQSHSLALRADGTVVAWGHDFYGQASVPENLDQVTAIAAGSYHSLALRRDGTVVAWGSNLFGQTAIPPGLSDAVAIAAGSSHSSAVRENRTLVAWGSNFYGQSTTPEGMTNVVEAGVGAARTIVVTGDLQPPRVISPLPSGTIAAGQHLTVVPFVQGSPPLIFQWVRDGRPMANANYKALPLGRVDARASGTYSVIVANSAGNTSSPRFSLEVLDPSVTLQVSPRVAILGETATFVARAAGTEPLSFRWRKEADVLGEAEGDTLVIERVEENHTGTYSVEVTNRYGTARSNEINFYVAPQIVRQPPEVAAARIGERVALTVDVSGSRPLEVQWMREDVAIPGATEPTLTLENISVDDGGTYSASITNPAGRVVTEPTLLQIAPHIVLEPEVQTFSDFGGTAVFEVRAIGTPPLVYRWMKDGELLEETEEPRLVLEEVNATEAGQYHVEVVNNAGRAESAPARLIVPPAIVEHPRSKIARAGEDVELSVRAAGSGPMQFQWFKNEEPIEGGTEERLVLAAVDGTHSGRYSVMVANEVGQIKSGSATLAVAPSVIAAPQPATAAAGESLILEVQAEGTPPLHYQWVKDGNVIADSSGNMLPLDNLSPEDAGEYSVVVSNAVGIAVSDSATIEVGALSEQYGTPPAR